MMVTHKEEKEVKNTIHGRSTAERRITKPWVVLAVLAVLSLIGLAASTACAGPSAPIAGALSDPATSAPGMYLNALRAYF